jgi:hypothetical protein
MLMVFAPIAVQKSLYIMHLGTYTCHRWPIIFAKEAKFLSQESDLPDSLGFARLT